jgi:hypothetical protein
LIVTAIVLWNISTNAKIAGLTWLAVGLIYYFVLRIRGRSTRLAEAIE